MRGGGSLKASLARVFSLAKNEQENSEQVIKKRCHAELDSASYPLGVLQGLQGVGLKAQPTVDSHMLTCTAMTEMDNCGECGLGFNPHQEHYRQVNLPSVLSSPNGEGKGINSITNLSPYRPIALTPLAKAAFTMAEILLSLTIIGVVAAITLPSLTGNINERTWNTQRKALYSRMSQAIALMPSVRGYGSLEVTTDTYGNKKYSTNDAAENFLSSGLAKVYKLNNICDKDHLSDCGLPDNFKDFKGRNVPLNTLKKFSDLGFTQAGCGNDVAFDSYAAAFETANGESLLIHYNPTCKGDFVIESEYLVLNSSTMLCANFIYDLNGKKGPNTMGKDVGFISLFYPSDSVLVAPLPVNSFTSTTYSFEDAQSVCRNKDNARLPNKEELSSMDLNRVLIDEDSWESITWKWTASKELNPVRNEMGTWVMSGNDGNISLWSATSVYSMSASPVCVKQFQ